MLPPARRVRRACRRRPVAAPYRPQAGRCLQRWFRRTWWAPLSLRSARPKLPTSATGAQGETRRAARGDTPGGLRDARLIGYRGDRPYGATPTTECGSQSGARTRNRRRSGEPPGRLRGRARLALPTRTNPATPRAPAIARARERTRRLASSGPRGPAGRLGGLIRRRSSRTQRPGSGYWACEGNYPSACAGPFVPRWRTWQ